MTWPPTCSQDVAELAEAAEVIDVDQDPDLLQAHTPRRRALEECRVAVAAAIAQARKTA